MLELLKEESNKTYTENGAVTYKGTKSYCLDLFSTIGALRSADETESDLSEHITKIPIWQ